MTTNAGRVPTQNGVELVVEALIKELVGGAIPSKSGSRVENVITAALTDELITSIASSTRTAAQPSSMEITLLAAALAPALADTLAPALADALTPAIIKALNNLISSKEHAPQQQSSQESAPQQQSSQEGSEQGQG